jgi:large subunit ribosomal protein L41
MVGKYRHLKLTTKDVGRGFYKGNRTGSMGRHTKYGGYVIEWSKVRTYVVPKDLPQFEVCKSSSAVASMVSPNANRARDSLAQLKPFVSKQIKQKPGDYKGLSKGASDPYFYVEQWKRFNGID